MTGLSPIGPILGPGRTSGEAGVDQRIRRDVLGHALNHERYKKGVLLKQLAEVLQAVAFPTHLRQILGS